MYQYTELSLKGFKVLLKCFHGCISQQDGDGQETMHVVAADNLEEAVASFQSSTNGQMVIRASHPQMIDSSHHQGEHITPDHPGKLAEV